MLKKWMMVSVILLIAVLLITLPLFTVRQTAIINAPVDEVAMQFNKKRNLEKWYPQFSEKRRSLSVLNPAAVAITNPNSSSPVLLLAESFNHGTQTKVTVQQKLGALKWIAKALGNDDVILRHLKTFMEDGKRRYGFDISIVPVTDTLILTKKMSVEPPQTEIAISQLYRQLSEFISTHDIKRSGHCYYVSSSILSGGKIEIATGIPVKDNKPGYEGYEFLKLPPRGRLLAGRYDGPYAEKNKLYAALDKYLLDKRYKKVAAPLEQYDVADTSLTREKKVTMTIYYPIY